nr:MAG TPA: hypothetical protein [Caudoviricetes sp.]
MLLNLIQRWSLRVVQAFNISPAGAQNVLYFI